MEPPGYSIVLPAYNEAERIEESLEKILRFAARHRRNFEIIVVNDGSTDATAEIVTRYSAQHAMVKLVENPGNRGKGFSVRNGMLHARGDVLLFSDADLSSPIEESEKLFGAIAAGADVAIGSRWLRTELQVKPQPLYRRLLGRLFNFALRMVLGLNYKDTQCGFKAFRRSAAEQIFPRQAIERWGFDPELLYLAQRAGLRIEEVPVLWAHREGTRIHPWRDGFHMFLELFKIRWNAISGRYRNPHAVSQLS
ncbi:MAG TPA: dolichyl-phosphate beta-glucosyltransferase [Terriglobales bacterium]